MAIQGRYSCQDLKSISQDQPQWPLLSRGGWVPDHSKKHVVIVHRLRRHWQARSDMRHPLARPYRWEWVVSRYGGRFVSTLKNPRNTLHRNAPASAYWQ